MLLSIRSFFKYIYLYFFPVVNRGKNNTVVINSKLGKNFHVFLSGNNNSITIAKGAKILSNTTIRMNGDNNHLIIEELANFTGPCEILMDGNSRLHFGRWSGVRGVRFLLKDANISIGEHCMFSYGIIVRNHDSHHVLDAQTGEITNHPKDIVIGKEVWIGENVTILKGVSIGEYSVVAIGSLVTKSCGGGVVIAGNPARIVKEGITWRR